MPLASSHWAFLVNTLSELTPSFSLSLGGIFFKEEEEEKNRIFTFSFFLSTYHGSNQQPASGNRREREIFGRVASSSV